MITAGLTILVILFIYSAFLFTANKYKISVNSVVSPAVYALCLALSLVMLFGTNSNENYAFQSAASAYSNYKLTFTLTATRLSAIILTLASFIAFSISVSYLNRDKKTNADSDSALLAFSLFGISGLALSGNILVLFIFSEIIGLASYIILNSENKRLYFLKTIIINTVSDVSFITGILLIFSVTRSFDFEDIKKAIDTGILSGQLLTVSGICLLIGVMAKSAAFPFHNWLTTNEKISDYSGNIFLSLSFLPAGIILAIRIAPVLEPLALNIMLVIGAISLLYGLIISGFGKDFRDSVINSAITHTGLMFIAIATGNSSLAIILLGAVLTSRLGLLLSYESIENNENGKQNILYYWLLFGSAIAYTGLPLSSLFICYAGILRSSFTYNIIPGSNAVFTILILCVSFFSALNIFKFIFRINRNEFERFSFLILKDFKNYLSVAVLLIGSLFIWYGYSPVDGALLWIPGYLNPANIAFLSVLPASVPYLDSLLVLISASFGIMAAYFFFAKQESIRSYPIQRFGGLGLFFDNAFAGILIRKEETVEERSAIDSANLASKIFKFEEPGAYISFSLLLIVIFYFIFRTM